MDTGDVKYPRLPLRGLVAAGLTCTLLTATASATWSIVIVDRATGELAVAQATCIPSVNLLPALAAVRVDEGVGIVQAWWDTNGQRRVTIANGLSAGKTPPEILADLNLLPNPQIFQFGIVAFDGPPVSWTGANAFAATCGVTGEVGSLAYAIQGNIMTGAAVCAEAEARLLAEDGDMVERLLAAMDGARLMGGDGRCSCSQSQPTSCGAPPASFTHSAYTAFALVSRRGDTDGTCAVSHCANGDYYLSTVAVGTANDPDPVDRLYANVATWRAGLAGRPDHLLSVVQSDAQQLPANGAARTTRRGAPRRPGGRLANQRRAVRYGDAGRSQCDFRECRSGLGSRRRKPRVRGNGRDAGRALRRGTFASMTGRVRCCCGRR